jgi:hypothetical protein
VFKISIGFRIEIYKQKRASKAVRKDKGSGILKILREILIGIIIKILVEILIRVIRGFIGV